MSGPWSGRAYVGLKYSRDGREAFRGRGERDQFFNRLKNWSVMIPLSTGRMLSGGTAWWLAVQRRLVIF